MSKLNENLKIPEMAKMMQQFSMQMQKMNEDLMEIIAILDMSGSMSGLTNDTIGGFNNYIKELKEKNQEVNVTLIVFNTKYNVIWKRKPIKQCQNIDTNIYRPCGGTALLDALGTAVTMTTTWFKQLKKSAQPGTVSFFVCTDGEENSSREFSSDQVRKLVTQAQEEYKWSFLFAGANIDAFQSGQQLGFYSHNIANIANDGQGQERFYKATIGQQMAIKSKKFTSFQDQYDQQGLNQNQIPNSNSKLIQNQNQQLNVHCIRKEVYSKNDEAFKC
uniref:von Willebrand factor type A domain-containing protein n=1 Tax=Trepomonas sp. PC1 TaxID=1076344 RepID=A0A146K804_9EUKA|eukprot:JAP92747.1 von Willebrand factor type A domain-containing protein [Trepomonas sp. PC1]